METVSKAVLCALVLAAAIKVMVDLRVWKDGRRRAEERAHGSRLGGTDSPEAPPPGITKGIKFGQITCLNQRL